MRTTNYFSTKYKIYNQQSKNNKIYCTVLYNMLHNYMFRQFLRPSSGFIRLALTVMSSGYITLKAKCIHPEDGLKRAETCSCVTYCTTQYNKFCCVSTATYMFCIQFIEHNGDVAPNSYFPTTRLLADIVLIMASNNIRIYKQ